MKPKSNVGSQPKPVGDSLSVTQAQAKFREGLTLHHKGQFSQAQEIYEQVLKLQPRHFEALHLLGVIAAQMKNHAYAVELISRAIEINQTSAMAYYNRGLALNELKQYQSAIDSYDKAIALKPDYANAFYNRGNTLIALTERQAALESYDKAIAIKPDFEFLYGMRLYTKMNICDWSDSENDIAELRQRIERNEKVAPPFQVLALSPSLSLQRQVAEIWVNEKHPSNPELGVIPKRPKGKKIRLGYFSMDFRNHPVAFLTAELFETHDRDKFEVYAFSFGPDTRDEMRTRLESAFDKFIDVKDKSDREIASLARQMQIDIAIDLAGFTADSRTSIFALRAAPIQINYLGYPGTMSAEYMDYLIADTQLIPEVAQVHYAEKIVYLPNTYMINDSKRNISDKWFTREELGLPQTGFVFCCFNNSYKITTSTFDGWMRILKRCDRSVLWLSESNPTASSNLRKEAAKRGVDPQRLVFARKLPLLADHLARHRAADLFIDTLPYNAHTTASDALWAGLPVLTCTGEAFAGRVAASLLVAIGLPELIASTQQEYEAQAIELATNPERLKAIRQKLEHNRLSTPLFDTKRFTKHIEGAYTRMIERYQADLPPEHICVS